MSRPSFAALCVFTALATTACGEALVIVDEGGEPSAEEIDQALTTSNGVNLPNGLNLPNGFILDNGIKLDNGISLGTGLNLRNGINLGSVAWNSLPAAQFSPPAGSGLEKWIDVAPTMRKRILKYMVECALPKGVAVKLKYRGVLTTLGAGVAGLGPSLRTGLMSTADQEKVTGCILARVNAKGAIVNIDIVNEAPGFNVLNPSYPKKEIAFYGNLFATTPAAYACAADTQMTSISSDFLAPAPLVHLCASRACLQPDGSCNCGIVTLPPVYAAHNRTMGCTRHLYTYGTYTPGACGTTVTLNGVVFPKSCTGGSKVYNHVFTARVQ